MFLYYLFFYLILVLCVSLLTLLERYYMSFSQVRLGPSKVFFIGYIQMIFDGLKLFIREYIFLFNQDNSVFFFIPIFSFLIILVIFNILIYFFFYLSIIINYF